VIRAIVTDIEGTTSSLSFVKDILFPYARKRMAVFVHEHAHECDVERLVNDVRTIIGNEATLDEVIEQLIRWIDEDKKITPLKALQGLIWEYGYRVGDFRGHIYPDAEQALRRWHEQGIALYVYSSGSVYAQKLLFGHTEYGDLTPLFSGYFDTTVGGKTEPRSYQKIAASVGLPATEILFLSDIERELDAASAAGFRTCWLVRESVVAQQPVHRLVRDFSDISV
jgi:enolase-phosphatase E1